MFIYSCPIGATFLSRQHYPWRHKNSMNHLQFVRLVLFFSTSHCPEVLVIRVFKEGHLGTRHCQTDPPILPPSCRYMDTVQPTAPLLRRKRYLGTQIRTIYGIRTKNQLAANSLRKTREREKERCSHHPTSRRPPEEMKIRMTPTHTTLFPRDSKTRHVIERNADCTWISLGLYTIRLFIIVQPLHHQQLVLSGPVRCHPPWRSLPIRNHSPNAVQKQSLIP